MSRITDIFGKEIRHLAVMPLLAVLCHGCGTLGNNLPSDEEMINTFHAKESTFNEMVELLQEFPSWEGFDSMKKNIIHPNIMVTGPTWLSADLILEKNEPPRLTVFYGK